LQLAIKDDLVTVQYVFSVGEAKENVKGGMNVACKGKKTKGRKRGC